MPQTVQRECKQGTICCQKSNIDLDTSMCTVAFATRYSHRQATTSNRMRDYWQEALLRNWNLALMIYFFWLSYNLVPALNVLLHVKGRAQSICTNLQTCFSLCVPFHAQ